MTYFKLTEEQLKKKKTSGTLRGAQIAQKAKRVTTRVDYNPERCKDYYEHGYCPFGDTCIYIHDRGDYKSGFQLDQEWEEAQRKKQAKLDGVDEDSESDYEIKSDQSEEIGNDCLICESAFKEPVQTPCGHIFCERCALDFYSKQPGCFKCGKPTNGTFKQPQAKQESKSSD